MKWFKHDCDMHTDLKIQNLIEKHGLEGYAIFNLCLEMVGKEGKKGKIDGQLRWRQLLSKVAGWSDNGKLDIIISTMGELGLICNKSLKYGNLYIPKFIKRADEYTLRKLRTNSELSTDNVRVDKNRIDKIIKEYIALQGWEKDLKEKEGLLSEIYKRNCAPSKRLILAANNDNLILQVMKEMASLYKKRGLSWTLETVLKHFPEFIKDKTSIENFIKE